MAENAKVVKEALCGYCRRSVIKSIKCEVCSRVYHPSCTTRLKKLNIVSDSSIICCYEKKLSDEAVSDTEKMHGNEVVNTPENKIEVTSQTTKLELMSKIIRELEEKNQLMHDNNALLKYKISILEKEITSQGNKIKILEKNQNKLKEDKTDRVHMSSKSTDKPSVGSINPKGNPVTQDQNINSYTNAVLSGLGNQLEIAQRKKMTEIINLQKYDSDVDISIGDPTEVSDMTSKQTTNNKSNVVNTNKTVSNAKEIKRDKIQTNTADETEWQKVSHNKNKKKKQKTLVVGSFSGPTNVEGIRKYKALHVSNLKPDTKVDDLQSFLLKNFSDVKCEAMKSRFPDSYSSFKVLIPSDEFEKVSVQSHWPNRASVHYFHQRRPMDQNR